MKKEIKPMFLDAEACYAALVSHDARFDGRFFIGEILACLSFPKTLMSQGRGQHVFSARSRVCGPFQLFCFAPKTKVFTRQ